MNAQQTVLVIDDETATLTMFRLFLSAYGYPVLTAESGEAGLELVRQHRPGIVFTDLKMPGMDGFAVLKEIKREAPDTEVIVITGHGDMDHVVQALNLEATDFINKPIGRSALDAALKRAEARLQADRQTGEPVRLQMQKGRALLFVRGTLSGDEKAALTACLEQAVADPEAEIVICFDHHSAVNGTGIALLTRLLSDLRNQGRTVRMAGLSDNFKAIFDMLGITRIAPCLDEAEMEAFDNHSN